MLRECQACRSRFERLEPDARCARCGKGQLLEVDVHEAIMFTAAWRKELARLARARPSTPGIDSGAHIDKPLNAYDVFAAARARRRLRDGGARWSEIYFRYLIGENNNRPNRKQAEVGYGFNSAPSEDVARTVADAWPFDRAPFDAYPLDPLVAEASPALLAEASAVVRSERVFRATSEALESRQRAEVAYMSSFIDWLEVGGKRPPAAGLTPRQAKLVRDLDDREVAVLTSEESAKTNVREQGG